ncbi:alpha/beta hydrolase [Streptomyces sp. NPDC047315]|uniref:alpha/beta hydrolase n=1 Tax=Streptomyces sp. NPDC047315 TaxID=3155142 RepID=UPI0033D8B33E
MASYYKAAALTLSVVTGVTTLTGTSGVAGASGASTSRAPTGTFAPALDWKACAKPGGPATQECATLEVPLDYRDPGGAKASIAVSRVRSEDPGERRGTLLIVPGGPGSSGVQRLTQKAAALRQQVGDAYDLVSLDPRGVGGSTRAECGLPEADRYLTSMRTWPDADGSIAEGTERSRRVAELCARNGGAVLRSFSSVNEARDIDRLRQALGERKLSIWSTSYGAYVTAVYAQKFPHRTDRLVLDSNGDPDHRRVARGWLANNARGVEDRFPDFAAWASDPARGAALRLGESPEEVRELVIDLMARLDRQPKPTAHPKLKLTGAALRQSLLDALYDDARFEGLAKLIKAAHEPAGVPVLDPVQTVALPDSDVAMTFAVICNDVRWPGAVAEYERAVAADRARYPLTGGMPQNITPCAFWKNDQQEEPTRITPDGPSNILMIQNRRDPAVPHSGALEMRRALGDRARMVTVERGGHSVYLGTGNACGDRTVTEFLTTGKRPGRDVSCPG